VENFLVKLAEILEVDEVKPSDVLKDFENWDSLTALSVLATLDASYGVNLTAGDLRKITTAGELLAKVESLIRK
jgi:acyl carrier protein